MFSLFMNGIMVNIIGFIGKHQKRKELLNVKEKKDCYKVTSINQNWPDSTEVQPIGVVVSLIVKWRSLSAVNVPQVIEV